MFFMKCLSDVEVFLKKRGKKQWYEFFQLLSCVFYIGHHWHVKQWLCCCLIQIQTLRPTLPVHLFGFCSLFKLMSLQGWCQEVLQSTANKHRMFSKGTHSNSFHQEIDDMTGTQVIGIILWSQIYYIFI